VIGRSWVAAQPIRYATVTVTPTVGEGSPGGETGRPGTAVPGAASAGSAIGPPNSCELEVLTERTPWIVTPVALAIVTDWALASARAALSAVCCAAARSDPSAAIGAWPKPVTMI